VIGVVADGDASVFEDTTTYLVRAIGECYCIDGRRGADSEVVSLDEFGGYKVAGGTTVDEKDYWASIQGASNLEELTRVRTIMFGEVT
jgi:hypothetical protein